MKEKFFNRCMMLALLLGLLPTSGIVAQPADKKATARTVLLYERLHMLQKKGIMFGHQDDLMYGCTWWYEKDRSDVKDAVGDYPAVAGFELGHLEKGAERSLDSVSFAQIRERIIFFDSIGGVITLSWHLDNPLTGGTAWDVSSKDVVGSVLPSGSKNALFNQWLDRLADFLLSLKDSKGENIPVIFRPYHEHSGSFFWWGKELCTEQQYVELWKYTINRLKSKGVHNVLYAYNTDRVTSFDQYFEGYPGDEYVDMLSLDMYDRSPVYFSELDYALSFVSFAAQAKNKLAALSECGGHGRAWFSGSLLSILKKYRLSYILTWRNTYGKSPQRGTNDYSFDFQNFHQDPHTLFLNDIKN